MTETHLATQNDPVVSDTEFFQKENPRSLYNLCPKRLRSAMDRIPEPYYKLSEEEIDEKIDAKANWKKVRPTLNCLRFRLWEQYNIVIVKEAAGISMEKICEGICPVNYLSGSILRNPLLTAWLIFPPKSYEEAAKEALMLGVGQLRKILTFPIWDDKGNPNLKTAKLQLDVIKVLDARLKGAPVQRVEKKNLNVSGSMKDIKNLSENENMKELEAQLKTLRDEEEKHHLMHSPRPALEDMGSQAIEIPAQVAVGEGKKKEY